MKPSKAENTPSVEAAQLMIQQERQKRQQDCAAEIEKLLKQYRCQLAAQCYFSEDGRLLSPIKVVALP